MARTFVRICNRALIELGADTISSLTQNSTEASLCNEFLEDIIDEVLFEFNWICAIERKDLAMSTTTPVSEYDYQYPLPSSPYCLRVIEMVGSTDDYRIEGRNLLTNATSCSIKYIKRVIDPNMFSPSLAKCISYKLAVALCTKIKESRTNKKDLLELYYAEVELAKGKNQMEATEPDEDVDIWREQGRG